MSALSPHGPTLLLQCVVGSQLHGTATPASDTDYRLVQASSLEDMLNPFGVPGQRNAHEYRGLTRKDTEVYEFQHWLKLLSQCNMTALEVLYSDKIEYEHPVMQLVKKQRHIFLDADRIHDAAKGYAKSQLMHVDRALTTGEVNTDSKRTGKFAAAYVRVMAQGTMLLRDGSYNPRDIGYYGDEIVRWKREGMQGGRDYQRFLHICELQERDLDQQRHLANLDRRFNQDIRAIVKMCGDVYVTMEEERRR